MQQPSSQRLVEVEDRIPFLAEGHPCQDLYHVLRPALLLGSVLDQYGRNPAMNQVKDFLSFVYLQNKCTMLIRLQQVIWNSLLAVGHQVMNFCQLIIKQ